MDGDWTVNFAELNAPGERAAVIVTAPLTRNEAWTAFTPGELKVLWMGRCWAEIFQRSCAYTVFIDLAPFNLKPFALSLSKVEDERFMSSM